MPGDVSIDLDFTNLGLSADACVLPPLKLKIEPCDLDSDDETYGISHEKAVKKAVEQGLEIVYPKMTEVQLDLDDEESYQAMQTALEILKNKHEGFHISKETVSKSGNKHVYITTDRELTALERVAFQACLGSDRKRELLSLLRVLDGQKNPSLLFETPEEAAKEHAPPPNDFVPFDFTAAELKVAAKLTIPVHDPSNGIHVFSEEDLEEIFKDNG